MKEISLRIRNKVGLHARPAARFVQTANGFSCNLVVSKDGHECNAKSILSVLGLGAGQDSVIAIRAEGEDETQAIEALRVLVESNFGES